MDLPIDRGSQVSSDPAVEEMLRSGILKPPPEDDDIDA